MSSASLDSEFWNDAAVPWNPDCKLAGKLRFLAAFSISVIAVPNEAFEARLNDTVTEGNCP